MATPPQTLSEHASKQLLADYGVPRGQEVLAGSPAEAAAAAYETEVPAPSTAEAPEATAALAMAEAVPHASATVNRSRKPLVI